MAWQGRPNRGHNKRWPPGAIGIGAEALLDPDHFKKNLHRFGPVFKSNHFRSPMVCVVGVARAQRLLSEHDAELGFHVLPYDRFIPGGLTRWMPEPDHTTYRRALTTRFSPSFLAGSEQLISMRMAALTGVLGAASGRAPDGIAPLDYVRSAVFGLWSELILGVEPEDCAFGELEQLYDFLDIYRRPAADDAEIAGAVARLTELTSLSDDPVLTSNLLWLTSTTSEDTAGLLMWLLKHLADNPEWLHAARHDDALANRIVSESVRLEQSEYVMRHIKTEFEFEGHVFPQDWVLRICIHESHRDAALFVDPDRFNPDRFVSRRYTRDEYAPFGIDARSCIGLHLTRTVGRIFTAELARGFDLTVVNAGRRELSAHRHWAPSPDFSVHMAARAHVGGNVS